ncbi:MAG: hypothetical protein A2Z94_03230 [Gallionellales bacterium GWA2_55_18]|nr:MAG: hypothetical protein A2Z94_03230 [Gallionellales bacterium GWA2_55_18]
MEERGTKTIMSGVLFLDIVEYSRKSVAGQISLKERFNSYLSDAIRDVPVPDRIILDTGDGAAINFLGDIEDALKAALSLRESIRDEDHNIDPPLRVRAGINLGPIRLVRDINGQPNIVGDGINVAQRVMGFAEVNQILVSRSYYDAVSRLSPQYAGMFHFQGSRTDKHVREHEIYAVGYIGEKSTELAAENMLVEKEAKSAAPILVPVKTAWASAASWLDSTIESIMVRFKLATFQQRALYIGAVAIAVVLIGVLLIKPSRNDKALPDIGQVQAASGVQPVSAAVSAVQPHAERRGAGTGIAPPVATVKQGTKKGAEPNADGKTADDQFKHPKPKVSESARKGVAPAGMDSAVGQANEAYISITCKEGTQLFVDGAEKGKIISTGLTVAVSPGKHKVIMTSKNGSLYTQNVELEPGKIAHIKPNFCD